MPTCSANSPTRSGALKRCVPVWEWAFHRGVSLAAYRLVRFSLVLRKLVMQMHAAIGRFDLACEKIAVRHHTMSEGYDYDELQRMKAQYDARRAARMGGQP
jgi:hypothetical protein